VELHLHAGSVFFTVKVQLRQTSSLSIFEFPLQSHQPELPKQFGMLRFSPQVTSRQGSSSFSVGLEPSSGFLQPLVALQEHDAAAGQLAHIAFEYCAGETGGAGVAAFTGHGVSLDFQDWNCAFIGVHAADFKVISVSVPWKLVLG